MQSYILTKSRLRQRDSLIVRGRGGDGRGEVEVGAFLSLRYTPAGERGGVGVLLLLFIEGSISPSTA